MEEIAKEKRRVSLTVFTQSEMQTFRDCRKKHDFRYRRRLKPRVAARALTFGSAFHAGPEALYRTIGTVPEDEVIGLATERGNEAIRGVFERWLKSFDESGSDEIERFYTDAKEQLETALWCFGHYVRTFSADIKRLVPIAVERAFSVPMRNVAGARVAHLEYLGVWDLIAFDPEYGDVVIFDHKTTSTSVDSVDRRVELDPQMGGYLYALRELLASDRDSFVRAIAPLHRFRDDAIRALQAEFVPFGRVAYNVVRKKQPGIPSINKDGTVSVAAIDTFASIYEGALLDQEFRGKPVTDKQRELLAKLTARGDTFIARREFYKGPEEIEQWRYETFAQASDLRATEADPKLRYRNPGHCTMPQSMACTYRTICLDESPETLDTFVVEAAKHSEVEEARKLAKPEED